MDAADWCRPGARSRGYKICCTVDGHKWTTYCVADLRSCFERKDQPAPAKVQSRPYLRLVGVERQLRSSTRCVRNWAGFGLGPAREIALKITETMRLPTLSYSAAEVRHGPLASASARPHFRVEAERRIICDGRCFDRRSSCPKAECLFRRRPIGTLPWIEMMIQFAMRLRCCCQPILP